MTFVSILPDSFGRASVVVWPDGKSGEVFAETGRRGSFGEFFRIHKRLVSSEWSDLWV